MKNTDIVLATQPVVAPEGLEAFTAWFVKNYPGPNTVIFDPHWHAPKIYRAALAAAPQPVAEPVAWIAHKRDCGLDMFETAMVHFKKIEIGDDPLDDWTVTPLYAAPPAELSDREARLRDSTAAMNCGSDAEPMTAAEEVLAWLLFDKIGVRDDCSISPKFAQDIIEAYFLAFAALEVQFSELEERIVAILDWCDLALKNADEFDSHGVRNLTGPVFDEARKAIGRPLP